MRSNVLSPNVVYIEAVHLTTKQVLFTVFGSHISMLNGKACQSMFSHDFP